MCCWYHKAVGGSKGASTTHVLFFDSTRLGGDLIEEKQAYCPSQEGRRVYTGY